MVEDPPIKTCVGCRICELACSFWHERKFNPQKSHIRIGEHPVVGVAPAILNAIYDAIGVDFYEIPVTPEKIKKALKEKKTTQSG